MIEDNIGKCVGCGENEGTKELHSCPYNEEINGDYSETCNCCPECCNQCYLDT